MSSTATAPAAAQAAEAWKAQIADQLTQLDPGQDMTHAVIWMPDDENTEAQLLDVRDSEASALVSAEDRATKVSGGEIKVVPIADLTVEATDEPTPEPLPPAAGDTPETPPVLASAPDPDKGQLFEMPKVKIDTSQPNLIALAFSGGINVTDRDDPRWVTLYNDLSPGKSRKVTITVFAAGAKKRHRRDKDDNVDAVVETKSLIVTDIHLEDN